MSRRSTALYVLLAAGWTVAALALFRGSQGIVACLAWAVGQGLLAGLFVFAHRVADGTVPPPGPTTFQRYRKTPYELRREQQEHLWDQARAAYLMNPEGQPPPRTDDYPGI